MNFTSSDKKSDQICSQNYARSLSTATKSICEQLCLRHLATLYNHSTIENVQRKAQNDPDVHARDEHLTTTVCKQYALFPSCRACKGISTAL